MAAVPVIMAAFSVASAKPFSVTRRICRRNASVSASTPSRANSSSSLARAKSFTVWTLV
jgi:hypothetical protein